MAKITISNINHAGYDLFIDSDSFLKDINDNEFVEVTGGIITP